MMTIDKAQNHPVLGKVIKENPGMFHEDCQHDWEQLILLVYVIYEY